MELHPEIEKQLRDAVKNKGAESVVEIWNTFKEAYLKINLQDLENVESFGIMEELFVDNEAAEAVYYFAMQYRLQYIEDEEEYEHTEMVYCQFKITDLEQVSLLGSQGLDLWSREGGLEKMFEEVESSAAFNALKFSDFELSIFGDEQ